MKKEKSTFGLRPNQLKCLFFVGFGIDNASPENENGQKEQMLRHRLAKVLPLDDKQIEMLPEVLGQLCQTMGLLASETILSLLRAPTTDLELIQKIKRYSKDLSKQAQSKAERDVAAAIYYASIAHALAFHDLRITKFSYEDIENYFARMIKEKWMTRELSVLFKIAKQHCKDKF